MGKDSIETRNEEDAAVNAKDAAVASAVAAKDYVVETAVAVKDYVAHSAVTASEKAIAAKDVIVEKAIHGKDVAIEKALVGKDFVAEKASVMKDAVVENAIAGKDFIVEKAVVGKDFVVEKAGVAKEQAGAAAGVAWQKAGEAVEVVKEKTLGAKDILANTAYQARSQAGVEANRQKGGVGPTAYETMVADAERAKAEAGELSQTSSHNSESTFKGQAYEAKASLANAAQQVKTKVGDVVEAVKVKAGFSGEAAKSRAEAKDSLAPNQPPYLQQANATAQMMPRQSTIARQMDVPYASQMSGQMMNIDQMNAVAPEQNAPQMTAHRASREGGGIPKLLAGATAQQVAKEPGQKGVETATPAAEYLQRKDGEEVVQTLQKVPKANDASKTSDAT